MPAIAPAPAPAPATLQAVAPAHAAGTFSLRTSGAAGAPAGNMAWTIDGRPLTEHGVARAAGVPDTRTGAASDSRYVTARLTDASFDPVSEPCDDLGHVATHAWSGVASATAVFRTDLELNQLTGRGTATVGLASSFDQNDLNHMFAPGQTTFTVADGCYGNDVNTPVDVMGDADAPLSPFLGESILNIRWPLVRSNGAWHLAATRSVAIVRGFPIRVEAHVTFTGTGAALHALCHVPDERELRPARTLAAAQAIMSRAGFPRTLTGPPKATRAQLRGRWYIPALVGNGNPAPCGYPRFRLARSLGWP